MEHSISFDFTIATVKKKLNVKITQYIIVVKRCIIVVNGNPVFHSLFDEATRTNLAVKYPQFVT